MQYEEFKLTYVDYKYYDCDTQSDVVLCTANTESKLNHEWIYEYKPAGSGYEKDYCNVPKCE